MNSLKLSKRVIGIALSILFVNVALADANSDARIQAYKANKLIPQNVVLPTSTGAADSDDVVVFNKSALSWKSDNALSASYAPLLEKYGDMTIDELRAAMGPAGTWNLDEYTWVEDGWLKKLTPKQQEIREYLSLVGNNKLKSDKLTSEEAMAYLQSQFDLIAKTYDMTGYTYMADFGAFPCMGISFFGKSLEFSDLSKCTSITSEQVLQADSLHYSYLPAIVFNGHESFEGKYLEYVDLSKCIGITGEQIISARSLSYAVLPTITFTGHESFTGKYLYNVDLSKCIGITASQIGPADTIDGMHITSAQYNEWKSTLQSKFNGKYIYVDGMFTKIQ